MSYNFQIIIVLGFIAFCSSYPLEDSIERVYLLAIKNQPAGAFYLPELINDFIDQDSIDLRSRPTTRPKSFNIRRTKRILDPFGYENNFEKRSGSSCAKHKVRIHRIFVG